MNKREDQDGIVPFASKIWLSSPTMHGDEIKYIIEAYESNWMSTVGKNINEVERLACEKIGCQYAVALSAGTAALHMAVRLAGVKPGDKVFCSDMTFDATVNPVVYEGGVPVFIDTEYDTWNMDPILLEQAICDRMKQTGLKPKAILPVHLYGTPARMNEICDIASRYGIPVVEDAAEAMGAVYDGRYCGTFGQYGIFSFNGNKMITTSGGGALLCHTEEEAQRVKFYATQAREPFPWYQHEQIGYNYRLSNVSAGIGRGQMRVVDNHIAHRRAIHRLYTELLAGLPGITVVEPKKSTMFLPNYWLTTIKVDSNETSFSALQLMQHLAKSRHRDRPLWKPLHLQPVFSSSPHLRQRSIGSLFNCGLCLPSGSMMTCEDVMRVADAIRSMR